jgi:hypothetical protein
MSAEHAHELIEGSTKRIAILIAALAAFLAIAEMGAKSAQTEVLTEQIEASDQWAFFQAKTIRQTVVRVTADEVDAQYKDGGNMPAALAAQVKTWRQTVDRFESDPKSGEGRDELRVTARKHVASRNLAQAAYHHFEYGSAAFQLAIVLASAAAVTSVMALAWIAIGLGLVGTVLTALGFLAPTLVHL